MSPGAPILLSSGPLPRPGEELVLPDAETRHARVRRLRDGDAVVVLDGRGGRGTGILARGGTTVLLERLEPPVGEPDLEVTVLLPVAEPARVEWAVEKATECGASAFRLVVFERSQRSHVTALAARGPRLARVAAEAVKQCGRTVVPSIGSPEPFPRALVEAGRAPGLVVLLTPGAPPLEAVLPEKLPSVLLIVVGPEGGLSTAERELALSHGALEAGLGPRILRLETATVVALARIVDRTAR